MMTYVVKSDEQWKMLVLQLRECFGKIFSSLILVISIVEAEVVIGSLFCALFGMYRTFR